MPSRYWAVEGETPSGTVWLIQDTLVPGRFRGVVFGSEEEARAWVDAHNEEIPAICLADQYSIVEDSDE